MKWMLARAGWRRLATAAGIGALSAALSAGEALAQRSAVVIGRITADSAGRPIKDAEIRIPQLDRMIQADATGSFRVEAVPPGSYVLIAEAPGYRARRAQVTLAAGDSTRQDFVLPVSTQLLATVDVTAKAPPRVSLKMVDFERRRQRGLGWYVTRSELERVAGRQLESVLRASVPGTRFVRSQDGQTWLVSSRQASTSAGFVPDADGGGFRSNVCHVQVILDGVVVSSTSSLHAPRVQRGSGTGAGERATVTDARTQTEGGDDPIDLNLFTSDQLEGVEFYPDATTTPVQYRTAGAVCGTLLLWTRDK